MLFHFNLVWLSGEFLGVDVFLVIPGYLIASILLEKEPSPVMQSEVPCATSTSVA